MLASKWFVPVAFVLAVFSSKTRAVDQETQSWLTARARLHLQKGGVLSFRARQRFSGFVNERRLQQYQFAAGTRLENGSILALGYELFDSEVGLLERRVFPEAHLSTSFLGLDLRHRVRAEIRDILLLEDTLYRLRYRVGHEGNFGQGPAYFRLENELFLSLSKRSPVLDRGFRQNRIGGALGYRMSKRLRLEIGYQWAYVDLGVTDRGDNLLQFTIKWDGPR